MANVRDLLIRMSLNTDNFKKNIADAKSELRVLKAEYKAISADSSLENQAQQQLEKLKEQKTAAEAMIEQYQKGIEAIREKLKTVGKGSQQESELIKQANKLEEDMNKAKASVSGLDEEIGKLNTALAEMGEKETKLDKLQGVANTLADVFSSLRLGFGPLLDGLGDMADSADQVYVSRESAWAGVTKILNDHEGYTEEWGQALDKWNKEVITRIPIEYEALTAIQEAALQAAGVELDGLREFSETAAELQAATNLQGEAGLGLFGKYLTVMGATEDEYHRLGSVVVALGNNFAAMEDQIVVTAARSASAMRGIGMSAEDGLAYATNAISMGMNEAAAATSLEKVFGAMAMAAEVGTGPYKELLDMYKQMKMLEGGDDEAAYQAAFQAYAKRLDELALDSTVIEKLNKSSFKLEKFAHAVRMTGEEFAQAFKDDPAKLINEFFAALGNLTEENDEGLLTYLNFLGITEVRAARLGRNFALNAEQLEKSTDIARQAYEEDKALDEEAQRRYATTESQRIMNRNKEQNALDAMGETVAKMRAPWDNFFGNLKQWFYEWPDWAQAGISAGTEVLGKAGDLLKTLGDFSFNLMNIATAIKEIEATTIGARILKTLGAAGSAAAAALPVAGLAGGTIALGMTLDKASTEKNYGDLKRSWEKEDQLLETVADDRVERLQAIFGAFSQAMKDTENIEPGEDRLGPVKDMFRRYANELLQEMPDLKFWDTASFYADLSDGLDEAEIEKIIQGMEFADQWYDLGNEAVTSLARAIEERKEELYQTSLDTGLQIPAGLAQGIRDGEDEALASASALSQDVIDTMNATLDIHSPSRRMEILGGYVAQGFARGIENGLARIEGAADRMANVMERSSSGASRAMPTAGNGRGGAAFIINIDGKAFAQAIAPFVDDALGEAAWP